MRHEYRFSEITPTKKYVSGEAELRNFKLDFFSDEFTKESVQDLLDFCNTLDDVVECRTNPHVFSVFIDTLEEDEATQYIEILRGFIESIS